MNQCMFDRHRRQIIKGAAATMLAGAVPVFHSRTSRALSVSAWDAGQLTIVSDGTLSLPTSFVLPESIDVEEREAFFKQHQLNADQLTPDCNLSLWRTSDRLVLFDVGAGPNFMPTAGKLLDSLAEANIDPLDVTDVVFTHAHPDHLWGVVDDFDELICPDATYHMSTLEWNYWRADDTLSKTPESRQAFVAGAQNRFPYIEERIQLFKAGDEVVPGVEAVDTRGHTPGHTSFALHAGSESILLIGDALTNVNISFEKPNWLSGSDQDQELGRRTRLKLLDRLAHDHSAIVGFHLPHPGLGLVETSGSHYRFVAKQ